MRYAVPSKSNARLWPAPWRLVLIALCTLILCSCRSTENGRYAASGQPGEGSLPPAAHAGNAYAGNSVKAASYDNAAVVGAMPCPQNMNGGVPMPYAPQGPWSPDGIAKPWPADEYLRDGGDRNRPAGVNQKTREVLGLGMEDTVAHYETADGRTLVEPSNEVHIYSPRFGAVRQVVGLNAYEEKQQLGGVHKPQKLNTPTTLQVVANAKQNIQADNGISSRPASAMTTKQGDGALSSAVHARAFQDKFMPFENLAIIRMGVVEESEMAFLAKSSEAAIAWSHTQAVQVVLDSKVAASVVKFDKTQLTYTVDSPPGCPKLLIYKVASTPFAEPGDTVDFTIRFDNTGNETINHVTILDSLSTRLEFVPDSGQCSVDAKFSTVPNEGDSLVVRCEVLKPLEPGHGGILRFRCRVR